jgi:hypothetical protein
MYLQYIYGVFECMHNVFECTYDIFVVYFNAFIVCFNVFQSVWMHLLTLWLEFHHHICIVTFLPCTPTYTFVFHSIQWLISQHAIQLHSFCPCPLIHSNFHIIYSYFPRLYITPHSTFHIPCCAEPKLIVKKCLKKYFHFYLFISIVVKLELVLIWKVV